MKKIYGFPPKILIHAASYDEDINLTTQKVNKEDKSENRNKT